MIPHDLHHFFVGQHVFVTGASGFIGSHVASLLVKIGAHVRAFTRSTKERRDSSIDWVEGDLLRRDSIDAAMKDCRYVFHVAGDYRFWARDSREIFANNEQRTINPLEAAKSRWVAKIVCTSTTGILEPGTLDRLASEGRLASPSQFKVPYKRSKFRSYVEVKNTEKAGWPTVTSVPTACASETAAQIWPNWTPFVTRESVQMSRGPHFSSNAKAENELGYLPTSSVDCAIHDAVEDFVARGLAPVAAGRFSSARERRRFFLKASRHRADPKLAAALSRHS